MALARSLGTVVSVSGVHDYVTDGHALVRVSNGHECMTKVTGLGCSLSALIAAFLSGDPAVWCPQQLALCSGH